MSPGSRRLRRWPRLIGVATAALVAGGTLAWAQTSRHATGSDAAPTAAQVLPVLARRAAAVRDHSASAFLADVDTGAASASFREHQRAVIAALAPVPLTGWTYRFADGPTGATITDRAALAAARQRYGRAVLIVHVQLSYGLRAVDPVATAHDLWWTFGRRDGRIVLLGDDDLTGEGGQSYRGPWDFGPLLVARGARSVVLAHPGVAVAPALLARAADAAVGAVARSWTRPWARAVAIEVPSSDAELAALLGSTGTESGFDAATVLDAQDPTEGQRYGQRVVLAPGALERLSGNGLGVVLRHEITHVATSAVTTPLTPRWLVEGYAEYVAELGTGRPVPTAAAELARAVRAGHLPAQLPSDTAFDLTSGSALAALYEQSWLACRLIATDDSPARLARLYVAVGAGAGDTTQNLAAALGIPIAAFVTRWRAYLRTELG